MIFVGFSDIVHAVVIVKYSSADSSGCSTQWAEDWTT